MKKLIFLFAFISLTTYAQKEVKVDLSNPNATVYTHLYFLQSDSYEPQKAGAVMYGLEGAEAELRGSGRPGSVRGPCVVAGFLRQRSHLPAQHG